MSTKLVLCDLDKTLIDARYNLTNEWVFDEVKRLQESGWIFGLNSDTPLEPLKLWMENLEFGNGPIIAERGSVVWTEDRGTVVVEEYASFFKQVKQKFVAHLVENNIAFYFGDATQMIRNRTQLPHLVEGKVLLVQLWRQCGLCFFGKKLDEIGHLLIDNQLAGELVEVAVEMVSDASFPLKFDYNKDYGICIVSPEDVTKRMGVIRLAGLLDLERIVVIGDSDSDIVGSDLATHYAVGNASHGLKEISEYVSHLDFTDGVADILSQLK